MNKNDLFNMINDLTMDLTFVYQGKEGAVCPISRNKIYFGYGDMDIEYNSIESLMSDPFFDGKSLNEIAGEIELL